MGKRKENNKTIIKNMNEKLILILLENLNNDNINKMDSYLKYIIKKRSLF